MEIRVDAKEKELIKKLVKEEVKKSKYPHTVVVDRLATDEVGDFEIADHYGTIHLKLERKTYSDLIGSIFDKKNQRWKTQPNGLLAYHERHPDCRIGILIEEHDGVRHAAAQSQLCRAVLPLEKLNELYWNNPQMSHFVTESQQHTARFIIELADDLALSSLATHVPSTADVAASYSQKAVKKRKHESGDIFASQLTMCGLTDNAAAAVRHRYRNWRKLVSNIKKHRKAGHKKPLLEGVRYKRGTALVQLGSKLAKSVEDFVYGDNK